MRLIKAIYITLLPLFAVASAAGATNSLTITEKAGVTTTNYPIQLGRPFVAGEIPNFPQAVVAGTPVPTQADIKQRWPDGTVKHAVLAFLIPQLKSGSTVSVTFQNQNAGNNAPQTLSQMQASSFDFNAQMLLTNGSTQKADARTMLNNSSYTQWTSGSIAQTIVLADHSLNRAYDIGFDANRAFRPIFHATFWPGINNVRVRFVGEIADTEALEDQAYSLALTVGNATPRQVYSKPTFTHTAATRWTKEFWIGGAPSAIAINHNLSYVRETKFSFYYDTSKTVDQAALNGACNAWNSSSRDLFDSGGWTKNQATAGGRPEIGPYPAWTVRWLYTGDKCSQDEAFGSADLSAAWDVHFREGKAGKPFNRNDTPGTAQGRVLSLNARPTTKLWDLTYSGTAPEDKMTLAGPATNGGWVYDPAHEPDVASVIYALTGDFWYLEEMWFWAAADAAANYPGQWERGPTGAYGVPMQVQMRSIAWILRNRVHAAFISPDATPEKTYFETLINDAIASEEGLRNITGTPFQGNISWNWGRNTMAPAWGMGPNMGIPPLHQWRRGDSSFVQPEYGIDTSVTAEGVSQFEQDFLMLAIGRGKQLGYAFGPLVSWFAPQFVGIVTNPSFNPYLSANGRMPTVRKSDGKYFDTWANLLTGYNSQWQNATNFIPTGQTENLPPNGYAANFVAAAAMAAGETGGTSAWNWVAANILQDPTFSADPKWALVPAGAAPPPVTGPNACDLNNDGVVDVADVQVAIDQILGKSPCANSDLDRNGRCDVIDVQRVINAASGKGCRVGP